MTPEELTSQYPRLYHMAERESWPSVQRLGLLSTVRLLDAFEVQEPLRTSILGSRRTRSYEISHPLYGTAVVRDQLPLNTAVLDGVLTDMGVAEWLGLLNTRVFFWLTEERVNTLLNARAYRDREHDCIQVDTAKLLSEYADRMTLSPINSGSTLFNPRPRGSQTFLPIGVYPFEQRAKARGARHAVVELAVNGGVYDVEQFAVCVERRHRSTVVRTLWK